MPPRPRNPSTFVGIDLGTTNSVDAHRNAYGRPEVLANREGGNVTPSVIYFGTDPPAVGQEAKEWARLGNDEIASFFKPQMGSPHFVLRFHDRDYNATDLSAIVLKRLKDDAELSLDRPVDRAVITVPAYFADAQRKATIEAGQAAGLRVLRIINEPTAAALAYGLQKTTQGETVLIYDLGGGTFDVTVARIEPDTIEVLSTAGDHDLGGKNWDDRIATYLSEKLESETGADPLDDPLAFNELLIRSEQAKWALSERLATKITVQLGSKRLSVELSRADFEAMTAPLMDRTRSLTEEALAAAGLDWKRLGGVLLVGGSTRMPMVRAYVTKMSGAAPRAGVNVDEVVALGAAIQAAIDEGAETADALPQFSLAGARKVIDVMAHSLGTVAVNAQGTAYVNDIVIPRNTSIPAESTRSYLHDARDGLNDFLEVYLTQGESESPLDCSILGKYVVSGFKKGDAEVKVDVGISYDANGVVQVKAARSVTGESLPISVEPVPHDLSWLAMPPQSRTQSKPSEPTSIYLLIDVSSSMAGHPLLEAQNAARAFLDRCDFATTQVGLISFSSQVTLQAKATDHVRKLQTAIAKLEPEGSTNLTDALEMARLEFFDTSRKRYIVILTDGYPDAPESAIEQALGARNEGIEIVAIGIALADVDYLRRLASTEAGTIFAKQGELVETFGHIAKMIAEGGRGLRIV